MEERLYPHYMHYQNYCMTNKLIERRTPAIQLNIVDNERAEITLARHVQRSIFGKIYTKLSLDAEKYVKAVSQIKNNQRKREMIQLANLKPFLNSKGVLLVHGRLLKTKK